MPDTKMTYSDINKFANSVNEFYAGLYGTPAEEITQEIRSKLLDMNYDYYSEDEIDPQENYEEVDGRYRALTQGKKDPVTEERLKERNIDQFCNEKIEQLKAGIDQNLYPEESYQRVMVDYMIDGLENIRNREIVMDPDNNPEAKNMPGFSISDKVANYSLVPKLTKEVENPITSEKQMIRHGPGVHGEKEMGGGHQGWKTAYGRCIGTVPGVALYAGQSAETARGA